MRKKIYWPYILAAYISLLSLGLVDNTRGPFLPDFTEDLEFTDAQASLIFVVPSFFSFLGCQLSHLLIYRISSLRGICYGMLAMGGGFLILAGINGIGGLVLGGGLFGAGFGMLNVFEHVAIQAGATKETRRKFLSGLHSMYALASLGAPLLIKHLYSLQWTWRGGFTLVAFVPLIFGGLFLLLKGEGAEVAIKPQEKTTPGHIAHYVYIGLAIACYIGSELIISSRIVLYVRRYTEATPEFATYYLAVFFLLLFIGRVSFIAFSRWRNEVILGWTFSLSALSFVCGLCVSPWFMSLCGLFMAPCFSASMDYVFDVFKEKAPEATAYAIGIASLLNVTMHYTVGAMSDLFGLRAALVVGPVLLVLGLLMLSLAGRIFTTPCRMVS